MTVLVGLVSGSYQRIDLLRTMIQSFRDNLLPGISYTITIVDGGSRDGTQAWCKSQPDIKLIEDGELVGAISAFTRGALATDAKYIVLANDDVTFRAGSIIPAIVHLENNMKCGAVCYADNRPVAHFTTKDYKVLSMAALKPIELGETVANPRDIENIGGITYRRTSVPYAQVGMFRKWLGDKCQWWLGEHDEMLGAHVYAGDNSLSAQIWHYGYTVDAVAACIIEDHVANDELRQINYQKGLQSNDSHFFYDQWPQSGVIVSNDPQLPQQDRRAARILYMPIYEPGWSVQKHPIHGKHGLRDALARGKNKYGATHIVQEFDYLASDPKRLRAQLMELADSFKPDLILTQIQSPQPITADMLQELKQRTGATVVNWNGDQAIGGLYSPQMLPIVHQIDLQLITNLDVVKDYEREHIKWAYWQIGYEESQGDLETNVEQYFSGLGRSNPFRTDTNYPVVFLASLRSPARLEIAKIVDDFGGRVFTPGDEYATLYNFSTSALIYKRAKVIISDNGFNSRGFVSNRLFQALASGGGVVLQQHVDGLTDLTGINGSHCIEWYDLDHLKIIIALMLENEEMRKRIATAGTAFVRANFSFDAQVAKLMTLIKERLGESEQLANSVCLKYVGRNTGSFGLGNSFPSGQRYEFQVGHNLYVKPEDVDTIIAWYPNEWEKMNV